MLLIRRKIKVKNQRVPHRHDVCQATRQLVNQKPHGEHYQLQPPLSHHPHWRHCSLSRRRIHYCSGWKARSRPPPPPSSSASTRHSWRGQFCHLVRYCYCLHSAIHLKRSLDLVVVLLRRRRFGWWCYRILAQGLGFRIGNPKAWG